MMVPERDEDEVFEGYMRTHFPGASGDRERGATASEAGRTTRHGDHGQPTEEEQFEAYMRAHFPAASHPS